MRFGSEFISVHTGIITRRRYHLRDTAIIFPDLRQNLVMKIFGMVRCTSAVPATAAGVTPCRC